MIGRVTRHILPHLLGVPHLHVNRPLQRYRSTVFVTRFTLALLSQSKIFRSAVGDLGTKRWIVFDLVVKQNENVILSHFITSVVLPIELFHWRKN